MPLASDANKGRQYKLADGSYIPQKGSKTFAAVTDHGRPPEAAAPRRDGEKRVCVRRGVEAADEVDLRSKSPRMEV